MDPVRSMLETRFSTMAIKRVSEDESYALVEYNLVLGKKNTIKFQSDPKVFGNTGLGSLI
jgi:hypothetical protein